LFVRNRNMPNPDEVPTLQATVSQPAAEQIALHDATAETGLVDLQVDRVYLPVHQEIYVDEGGHPLLAWTILIRRPINVRTRALSRRYWIAARGEPRILAKEDLIQRDAVVGSYWKLSDSPLGQSQQGPLAFLNVGTAAGTSIISDKNGEFTKAAGMVFSDALHGPFCEIRNDAAPAGALQPQTSGNQRIFPGSTELHLSQVSAFHWITQARLFVDDFLPHNPTILNVIPTHVNVDDECNAFWDPPTRSLNFFRASTPPRQCVNTAYAQIVFHEYGHAVDEQFEGIMDKAYSEGFGDALSMLITRGSLVGRDFHGPNQHLRDNKQVVRWPVTGETEPHTIGQAYAGFVWQLTRELKSKFNGNEDQAFAVARHLILGAAQLNPQSIPEAVIWSFYVDHQAGGTYFHQLAAAADSRKLPRPAQPTDLESLQQIAALVGE
ncbi:MAG TPA: hypothetical protein VFF52_31015, partial [Isosphaeraceae bacterium]|nr:hypothetical protein [Isosphaeraceae bacterium]